MGPGGNTFFASSQRPATAVSSLKNTLNLPQTDFPMRASLVKREPARVEHWKRIGLYRRLQERNEKGEVFLLHDGPPFTNGDVHIGTALNKTLKDIILRFQALQGRATPYYPGWDCHGLPIEHKVSRQLQEEGRELSPLETRQACAEFSRSYIERQRQQFERMGVLADWENEYRTMDPAYEAEILRTFADFVEQGFVYRSKKPVYWSIPCRTALAEAEIEYRPHVSPAVFVAFPREGRAGEAVVIWTTTPWTLPANRAVAVHPEIRYEEVESAGVRYRVATEQAAVFAEAVGGKRLGEAGAVPGRDLEGWQVLPPFAEESVPVVAADFVTADTGTGCVHIAPGHGEEDYLLGRALGLEVYSPLDDDGRYRDDGRIPEALVGASVLEDEGGSEANRRVLSLLGESGRLLASGRWEHSYPHCWRSKTPVVFRAMDQWFVALDHAGLRSRALEAIDRVAWEPAWGSRRIRGAVESRPDWCVSRQRSWGVPVPAFFDGEGEPYLDAGVVRAVAAKVAREGSDLWFRASAEELLAGIDLPAGWDPALLRPGGDTLDVWIDSGCSHRAVLRARGLPWPADLYLEGSDQHRGWFQSSLWTAMASFGEPPYRGVLTHGFVVGQDGRKVSKSDGKPLTVDRVVEDYGADIVRLWTCSEDYRGDLPFSEEILSHVSQAYRNLRNTLRFQIGNLFDFTAAMDAVEPARLDPLDQWALGRFQQLLPVLESAYREYAFHRVYQEVTRFCGQVLSATYHDILKDRLYTLAPGDPLRRSSQSALFRICDGLCRVLSPVLAFTADEAYSFLHNGAEYGEAAAALAGWPTDFPAPADAEAVAEVEALLQWKSDHLNEVMDARRQDKTIASSLDARVTVRGGRQHPLFAILERWADRLPEWWIVSQVELVPEEGGGEPVAEVSHAEGVRCPRTWRWVPSLVETEEWGPVSARCAEVLRQTRQPA